MQTTQTTSESKVRVLIPVRYAAWIAGELGKQIQADLKKNMRGVNITMLPRGFLVESDKGTPGSLTDRCHRAIKKVEAWVGEKYPVFHKEMGPVWTGTTQAIA